MGVVKSLERSNACVVSEREVRSLMKIMVELHIAGMLNKAELLSDAEV